METRETTDNILIPKEWLKQLVFLVDEIGDAEDEFHRQGWITHLLGYVHSLDKFLKDED